MSRPAAESAPENTSGVIYLHRSWLSVAPRLLLAVVAVGLVWLFTRDTKFYALDLVLTKDIRLELPAFLLVGFVLAIRPLFLLADCKHEIAEHHVRSTQGIFSLRKQFAEIPYEEILGVRASQNILDRLAGTGSVVIWTASAERPDLVLRGIRDPEHYARVISRRIDAVRVKAPPR